MDKLGIIITGTGTSVGKTVSTSLLLRALLKKNIEAKAVKIIQTGTELGESDAAIYEQTVQDLAKSFKAHSQVLHSLKFPSSPHLALAKENLKLKASKLAEEIKAYLSQTKAKVTLFETAGGLHVPLNESEDQLDLLQYLNWPVVVCMANGLGAINHTLLTLKAIKQAGLPLLGVIANELKPICKLNKTDLEIAKDNNQILAYRLKDYQVEGLNPVFLNLQYLDLKDLNSLDQALKALDPLVDLIINPRPKTDLVAKDRQILWHPYTKANQTGPLEAVKTSYANRIVLTDGRELIDGMSSWWCAIHGYKHPKLVEALQTQAAKLSHIMFGGLTHEPAVTLASRLLKHLPKNLSKIFWADSGSVAVEVALKMAWQYQVAQGKTKKKHFLTLRGGYHGDTLGAMSVCDPINGMHHLFKGFLPPHFFTERPSCPFSKPFDPQSLKDITSQLEEHQEEIAAIILEPIVQGAGGMWFYHPLYLKEVAKLAKEADCLLIFDEIATGFGHTGKFFAADWAELRPDILCLGKALTGGMLTLAATACTEEVAQGISSRGHPFMHGPTFMANPLALSVALAGLDLMEENLWRGEVAAIEATLKQELAVCQSLSIVKEVRVLGDIGVVETFEAVDQDFLMAYFTDLGVWIRPFNNLVYIMPPYISPLKDIKTLCQAIYLGLKALENRK